MPYISPAVILATPGSSQPYFTTTAIAPSRRVPCRQGPSRPSDRVLPACLLACLLAYRPTASAGEPSTYALRSKSYAIHPSVCLG
ncbi:hypothetical protein BO78DRAFT_224910 [Aspergillus sclerotiicarbonarius CBS 121057]|uniref:Uncharacterized protein n=1 Tax=Aspergillus sclerotiicarbonarius (strain CBS 121057 / IBT 28362) TaxID=1448318 RepID=A0A319DX22_ASPSB|nr:hypothetical protein BO78DRAFT_224910 [Aspergillus sclerotiicarbonarius CBS 121057]